MPSPEALAARVYAQYLEAMQKVPAQERSKVEPAQHLDSPVPDDTQVRGDEKLLALREANKAKVNGSPADFNMINPALVEVK